MEFCNRKGVDCECLSEHSTCNSDNCHRQLPDVDTHLKELDELKKEVADLRNRLHLIWAIGCDYDGCNTVESLKELIDELVSYTQLPREQVPDITSRTGRWIQSEEWAEDYTCSLCGNTAFKDNHGNYNVCTEYCPHCGAKMDGDA